MYYRLFWVVWDAEATSPACNVRQRALIDHCRDERGVFDGSFKDAVAA